jgi:hypothetical protein
MTGQNPIIGDLIEEYREVVRPARGRLAAGLWLARQLASFVRPWMWGAAGAAVVGALAGAIGGVVALRRDRTSPASA